MNLFDTKLSNVRARSINVNDKRGTNLKWAANAAIACLLLSAMNPSAVAQSNKKPIGDLPAAPQPNYTGPLYMRSTPHDFTKARNFIPNPIGVYTAIDVDPPAFGNSPRLGDLVKDGKIYLSLSDAVALALENNFDIAIARYNLDIADTDILRTKAGSIFRGVNAGLVTGTLGGTTSTTSNGGGPGGTTSGTAGAGSGVSGITATTSGSGPLPENLDPYLTGTVQLERATTPQTSSFAGPATTTNTDIYDFGYNQGFLTGTALTASFNNNRTTTNAPFTNYSPALGSNFRVELTQHLLQGFGRGINGRFITVAKNDRQITDSSFRQQVLYTINQVENIYWGLVSAYEDVQAKQRALEQSKQVTADNRKQLEIGTLAPLDVVNSDSQVASDQQALINSQSTLEYQQLIIKQALARNLNDPALSQAPVIPTDRVSLLETPEEKMSVEDLVKLAYTNRPDIEQSIVNLKNDEITFKALKNGLLPVVDLYAFYGASGVGGQRGPGCVIFGAGFNTIPCTAATTPTVDYGHVFQNLFNNSGPDKAVGVNINIPLRNRTSQADQARSVIEYRQNQLRLQQLYTQIRMNVINQQYLLTNDRAQVQAAQAAREFQFQSLDSERKKYRLGASTTALVLQQQRSLAAAEATLIADQAAYAEARAGLYQILASTLDRYGISLSDAVSGKVTQLPRVPGLEAPKDTTEPVQPSQPEKLQQQEQQPSTATPPATPPPS
jgi:outer membrane protein TolC